MLRLLPWAVFAAAVAILALRTELPGQGNAVPPGARGRGESALEIRLGPVEMREIREDGTSTRLAAREAVYSYARKTVVGTGVEVSLGRDPEGSVIRSPRAFWDFPGKRISLPDGGTAERGGAWKGEFASAEVDLEPRILRVPGEVTLSGPGLSIRGRNLEWHWTDGKVTLDAPKSRIAPASLPGRKG